MRRLFQRWVFSVGVSNVTPKNEQKGVVVLPPADCLSSTVQNDVFTESKPKRLHSDSLPKLLCAHSVSPLRRRGLGAHGRGSANHLDS